MGSFDKKNEWVSWTKKLRDRFGGLSQINFFPGIDETPPPLVQTFKSATKRKWKQPIELSSLADDILVKIQTSQNTDLDMRVFFGIDKTLQAIQSELVNVWKITKIDKRIKNVKRSWTWYEIFWKTKVLI